ncbi:MAG: beta-propeller fold lactonase family protein, partial [Desulfobacterales bacterium]|nr:beta-propeller fold lactonase family protein [Desulfobacterales bacterium]
MTRRCKILLGGMLMGLACWLASTHSDFAAQAQGAASKVKIGAADQRLFVGERACRQCHHPGGPRDPFNVWRLSPHSRGHASLAMVESDLIARLSGIKENVFTNPVCLGCHATGADAEKWKRDKGFFVEDGIQCEFCHGAGSDYAVAEIMADPEASAQAGLRKPDKSFCMTCHKDKGSHMAALKVTKFDFDMAWKLVKHERGKSGAPAKSGESAVPVQLPAGPRFAGGMACASCHKGKRMGFAFSKWRMSSHARAYAVLGTEEALRIAGEMGVTEDPQKSRACLKCHATGQDRPAGGFLETFDPAQGVQCESCHGPGSDYMLEAVMLDPVAARRAGLLAVDRKTCEGCHTDVHGNRFDPEPMLKKIDHAIPRDARADATEIRYKTPFNLAITRDGTRLFAACEASDSLVVVDAEKRAVLTEIPIGKLPHGVCLSPDETRIYVSNRGADSVSVIDAATYKVLGEIPVGDEPHDLITDREGKILYVANAGSHDISVVDAAAGREVKRLSAGRGAWGLSPSPSGRFIYATNNLSHFVKFRDSSRSEVTVIETENARVDNRIMIPDANLVQGIDFSPDGEFALVTLLRTKNLLPITRVMQGWMITNGLGVLWKDGRVDQLLLDEVDNSFADPTDVVITPDGRYAYVTGGGVDQVAVVDVEKLKQTLARADEKERVEVLPNHMGASFNYVLKRIDVGIGPRGLIASRDGRFVYVADALDDTVSVIDVARQERVDVIDLGGPGEITLERKGERVFHSAAITYGTQYSCHSCHPDGGIDGLTYDIEPDGLGYNPVDNRTLRGVLDTAPFKWTGKNPSLRRQCGPRLAVFFTRIDPFNPEQVVALDRYI